MNLTRLQNLEQKISIHQNQSSQLCFLGNCFPYMRVKLDDENQKIITCPESITKIKTVMQSEMQEDKTFIDVETPTSYDITGYQNSQESLDDGFIDIDDALVTLFNQDKAIIKNNSIVDIQETEAYKLRVSMSEKEEKILSLQSQIDELDKKRIRAICEPSIKDEITGQTWLGYYNLQVQDLRNQITELG